MSEIRQEQIDGAALNTNDKDIIDSSNEVLTNFLSSGYQSGGALTDNLDGTVDIALGTGYIRQSDSDTAILQYATWATASAVVLTDGQSNYIYVDYNAGTPVIAVTLSGSTITENENDKFELYEVVREGTDLHITDHRQFSNNVMRRSQQRFYDEAPIKRTSGLIISEAGTRNVTVSAGVIWTKLVKTAISAIDTSGSDTFDRYYRATPSGWTKQSAQTQWDNLNYDDGTGTLNPLGVSKWANQFFYMEADGALVSLYGQDSFNTELGAEGEGRPGNAPVRIEDHAVYIGRCIFQQNAATATFKTSFEDSSEVATVQNHNELGNLGFDISGHGVGFSGFQRGTTNDTSAPTANDDDSLGYRPGDLRLNTSTDLSYICADASTGAAIWGLFNTSNNRPMVVARRAISSQTNMTGDGTVETVGFNNEDLDNNNDYNDSTNIFTAPITGMYNIQTSIFFEGLLGTHDALNIILDTTTNGPVSVISLDPRNLLVTTDELILNGSMSFFMNATDTAHVDIQVFSSTKVVGIKQGSFVAYHLISAT